MTEATQAAEYAEPTTTSEEQERAPYEFARAEFELVFPVKWPNKDGRITVTHTLRKPTYGELIDYKRKTVIERQTARGGETTGERAETAGASAWLWDQLAVSFEGYPGLNGRTLATRDKKDRMKPTHKERAIDVLLGGSAEIVAEESAATFDGGEWVVLLRIGPRPDDAPIAEVRFIMREWTQAERNAFERAGADSRSKNEGKTTVSRFSVNLRGFCELFDAILVDCRGGVAGGKTLAEVGRDQFAREVMGEYKLLVVTELVGFWQAELSD